MYISCWTILVDRDRGKPFPVMPGCLEAATAHHRGCDPSALMSAACPLYHPCGPPDDEYTLNLSCRQTSVDREPQRFRRPRDCVLELSCV